MRIWRESCNRVTAAPHVHVATVDGGGPPAIMIHCALGKHQVLLALAKQLPYATTLFDMPGHGQSAPWDRVTDYQKATAQIAERLCQGPTHLIGHSFGATAALRLAVERPDLVNRLTLIEPVYFVAAKGHPAHQAHAKAFRPFVAAMLQGDDPKAAQIFNDLWGTTPWADLPQKIQDDLTRRIDLIVAGGAAIEEDADGIASAQRLAGVQSPVTLIRGSDTQPVIAAIHDRLMERLPNATDHVVDGAAHMVAITHPAQVAQIIRAADPETD